MLILGGQPDKIVFENIVLGGITFATERRSKIDFYCRKIW